MKKFHLTILMLCALVLPSNLIASSISVDSSYWIGSRSTGGNGIVGTGGWSGDSNNGFELDWEITYDSSSSLYTYKYSISGVNDSDLSKALSHWILEVTNPSTSVDFTDLSQPLSNDSPKLFLSGQNNNSNPFMPADLYGIKWDTTGDPTVFDVEFTTAKDPVWGNFYAKDGQEDIGGGNKIDVAAWNVGFTTLPIDITEDFTNWIARPNGGTPNPIPEPTTMLLFGIGLAGLAGAKRKLKSQ